LHRPVYPSPRVCFERLAFIANSGLYQFPSDEPSLLCGDLLLVALSFDDFRKEPFVTTLLLLLFVELLLNRGKFGFDRLLLSALLQNSERSGSPPERGRI